MHKSLFLFPHYTNDTKVKQPWLLPPSTTKSMSLLPNRNYPHAIGHNQKLCWRHQCSSVLLLFHFLPLGFSLFLPTTIILARYKGCHSVPNQSHQQRHDVMTETLLVMLLGVPILFFPHSSMQICDWKLLLVQISLTHPHWSNLRRLDDRNCYQLKKN